MAQTTLSGAIGQSAYTLNYQGTGLAFQLAQGFMTDIDNAYTSATLYEPNRYNPAQSGALIIGDAVANNRIDAVGFGAVIDENNISTSTIRGGGDQIILAGDGGLTFWSLTGNDTIDAGGGNNHISLRYDSGSSAIYTGDGNDTIWASNGSASIAAGGGYNKVYLGSGRDTDTVTGYDTIRLGGGSDTITVQGDGSAVVRGAQSVSGSGYSLTFVGGSQASTVHAGAGSYSIFGGAGGGLFYGGMAGNNSIVAGSGNATIVAGGGGDTLLGGSGNDFIVAGIGNETLGGGGGDNVFSFDKMQGAGAFDTITDFDASGASDQLQLTGGQSAVNYALTHYQVTGAGDLIHLQDGTQILLSGYSVTLTNSDFKSH